MANIARMAHDAIEEWLKGYAGYRGTIVFTDEDAERARIITLWDTAAAEISSRKGRTEMRNRVVEAAGMSIAGVALRRSSVRGPADLRSEIFLRRTGCFCDGSPKTTWRTSSSSTAIPT